MNLFYKGLDYLKKNKKNIAYIGIFFLFMFLSIDISFAANDEWDFTKWLVTFLNWVNKWAAAILWILTFLVWLFLNPSWISWSVIWLTDPLKTMWIMISNVVYFIFAFIFIWIAFMNIIWKEDYQLKQAIPRFIGWVLMVPFSWFFVQFIISLSSILSVWILTLPYDTFKSSPYFSENVLTQIKFCNNYTVNTNASWTWVMQCNVKESEYISLDKLLNPENSNSLYWIVNFYTYTVMRIDSSWKLFSEDIKEWTKKIIDIPLKMIIDILFFVIYLILMIALALALFVRVVMLWVFAMFSPVFWLLFFFKKWSEWAWEWAAKNFNIKQFINLALVPVYVCWALSFWMLFIFIAWNGLSSWDTNNTDDWAPKISEDWKKITAWGFTLTLSGSHVDSSKWNWLNDFIAWFQWSLWTFLLQLFGLGILWVAVMAALKSSDITKSVVDPFAEFGNSIWWLLKKLPTYAPIIPAPGWPISSSAMANASQSFKSAIEWNISTQWSRIWQDLAKSFWIWNEMLNKLDQLIRKPYTTQVDIENWMREALSTITSEDFKTNSSVRDRIWTLFWKLWATDSAVSSIKTAKDVEQLSRILNRNDSWDVSKSRNAERLFTWSSPEQIQRMIWSWSSSTWTASNPVHIDEIIERSEIDAIRWDAWNKINATRDIYVNRNWNTIKVSHQNDKALSISINWNSVQEILWLNWSDDIAEIKELLKRASISTESDIKDALKKIFSLSDWAELNSLYDKVKP